jgi:hypothetical protein
MNYGMAGGLPAPYIYLEAVARIQILGFSFVSPAVTIYSARGNGWE